mmetsp:Transcript_23553/g.42501  ORF Transcript_23553/g.42501 Transcript_23553/m.42501 type:complete len:245 (-) Transcript_23553:717-1451(-)
MSSLGRGGRAIWIDPSVELFPVSFHFGFLHTLLQLMPHDASYPLSILCTAARSPNSCLTACHSAILVPKLEVGVLFLLGEMNFLVCPAFGRCILCVDLALRWLGLHLWLLFHLFFHVWLLLCACADKGLSKHKSFSDWLNICSRGSIQHQSHAMPKYSRGIFLVAIGPRNVHRKLFLLTIWTSGTETPNRIVVRVFPNWNFPYLVPCRSFLHAKVVSGRRRALVPWCSAFLVYRRSCPLCRRTV